MAIGSSRVRTVLGENNTCALAIELTVCADHSRSGIDCVFTYCMCTRNIDRMSAKRARSASVSRLLSTRLTFHRDSMPKCVNCLLSIYACTAASGRTNAPNVTRHSPPPPFSARISDSIRASDPSRYFVKNIHVLFLSPLL